jgi:hypothetical protein
MSEAMARGRKYGEHSMSLAEFYKLVSKCSPEEIDRLRNRYQRYYLEHRQPFTDLLVGKFTNEDSFREALLDARIAASLSGKTSAPSVKKISDKSYGGFARTNERKLIKLATRILYLRMTSAAFKTRDGKVYAPWPLPCDSTPPIPATEARKTLAKTLEPWGVGIEAIRRHTRFQDDA